ncbi:hypothetical protein AMTRI_Chr04g250260 [Amborella trichopoda]
MDPPSCCRLTSWTLVAAMLQISGLFLFILGFFPVKPALTGVSGPESYMPVFDGAESHETERLPPDQLRSLYQETSGVTPLFDRLILMVVDGLPAEFVLGKDGSHPSEALMNAMPYTQSLLLNGKAVGYHARAAPPTVTMPRLKAMISGAIAGFLDVAFNFNTQALLDDNLLGQLHDIGWKMVMLGDETWIKLFPGLFTRQDGVSSFYVKDTVEVDYNVSRHLEGELAATDWDLLILHYLGLDHVGHIGGRHSPLMVPKLKEMDEVIEKLDMAIIHHHKCNKRTLLMVVSDHGMTDGGNHGGSSDEETDSMSLFIGLDCKVPDYASLSYNSISQVDMAPTLALLLGVPIPKNNVGILIRGIFDSLTDRHCLRALELNSWQLLRLLKAHVPGFSCRNSMSRDANHEGLEDRKCNGSIEEKLCCLLSKASSFHYSWKLQENSSVISDGMISLEMTVEAYYQFLETASDWLSRKTTEKPVNLLASGIAVMFVSFAILLWGLLNLCKEFPVLQKNTSYQGEAYTNWWHLDEIFALMGIMGHVLSLSASSMVEEEQYTWHFLASGLYFVFLRKAFQRVPKETISRSSVQEKKDSLKPTKHEFLRKDNGGYLKILSILLVLILGRILRGWHQGGVNWTHLPDVSKWLEHAGSLTLKSLQVASVIFVVGLGSLSLFLRSQRSLIYATAQIGIFVSGFLVVLYIMEYQHEGASAYGGILIARMIYGFLGFTVLITAIASPWIIPKSNPFTGSVTSIEVNKWSFHLEINNCTYLVGSTYVICWCLLQLLLQQPINAVPVVLLLMQLLGSLSYFSIATVNHKKWVEVASLYFLGMTGHFGLGNSNTLATVDVAGAYIGLSSHSTFLSGILALIITYASLLLFLPSTILLPMKDFRNKSSPPNAPMGSFLKSSIGMACLMPLVMNSIVLISFTFILLLMRNHLFVWSVFSPKYLYVCANTVSIYIGVSFVAATGAYTCLVFFMRSKLLRLRGHG